MTIMTKQVGQGDHDADQAGSTVAVTGGALNANASTQYIGLLFIDCSELVGTTINDAYLEVYFTSGSFDDPYAYIKVHEYGNRVAWVGGTNEISGSSKVIGSVTWDETGLGIGWETSPSFTSLLQSLIDGGNWPTAGYHNIAIELVGIDSSSLLRIQAYEGNSTLAAKFVVDYSPPGTEYTQGVAGSLTSAGAVIRSPRKVVAGTLTSAGNVIRLIAKSAAGALTSAGNVAKTAAKSAVGALTTAGTLAGRAGKALAGTLSEAGNLARETRKSLGGSLTLSGISTTASYYYVALSGAVTSAGVIVRHTGRALAGTLATAGDAVKSTARSLAGALSLAGAIANAKSSYVLIGGIFLTAGDVARTTGKGLTGVLTTAGDAIRATARALTGALSMTGDAARATAKVLGGALDAAGDVGKSTARALAGSLSAAGAAVVTYVPGGLITGIRELTARVRSFALIVRGRP